MKFNITPSLKTFLLRSAIAIVVEPSCAATARPVSFLGGTAFMTESRAHQSEAMLSYTFDRHLSLGLHASSFRYDEGEINFVAPILNYLPTRLNAENQQTNFYLGAGYGSLSIAPHQAAFGSIEADTESRSLYFSLRHEQIFAPSIKAVSNPLAYSRLRLGLSPYLAEFGSIHIWALAQYDYDHWRQSADVTPMLRFFFQNVLWELGASFRGRVQFNWSFEL